ncbi:MAG TPA: hypothetical protein VH370_20455, partial [Humisphaera sp.]|nr:hypothetical protein [Humisphaera sp.]
EPIGKNARLLYEKLLSLPQHQAMITSEILDWFMSQKIIISEDVLRKEILPQLNLYGIKNKPRIGYFIPASARPQSGDTPR